MNLAQLLGPYRPPQTHFVDRLRYWADVLPEPNGITYLVDGELQREVLSLADLDRRARSIAVQLLDAGLAGERILLLYPPCMEFVAGLFGCFYAGAVAVPAFPPRRNRNMDRLRAITSSCGAKAALTTADGADRTNGLLDEAPELQALRWIATDQIDVADAHQWRSPGIRAEQLAMLQYTSGSTGTPKGVMLTQANIMHNCSLISAAFETGPTTVGMSWLPTYHDMGLVGGILNPVFCACRILLMSPVMFLQKPVRWLSAISRERVTVSGGPNFAYDLCTDRIDEQQLEGIDLSSWRVAFNGAEPVRAKTLDEFCRKFGRYGFREQSFYPCYGMAETTLIVTGGNCVAPPVRCHVDGDALDVKQVEHLRSTDIGARELIGCGQVLPSESVLIVDPDTRQPLGDDQVGEIWISSASVAEGYWNQLEETEQAFRAHLADSTPRSFLRSGDLGFFHAGELFVTGRLKDMIIVRGVNRYPQDIEMTVEHAHPRLRSGACAAFAVDVAGQERLVVVCEVERGPRMATWDEVLDAIRREVTLAHDLPPDGIILVRPGSVPKTSSGKIQRKACRQAFFEHALRVVAYRFNWEMEPVSRSDQPQVLVGRFDHLSHYQRFCRQRERERQQGIPHPFFRLFEQTLADPISDRQYRVVGGNGHARVVATIASFSSGDYLGLAQDDSVRRAAQEAIVRFGTNVASSRPRAGQLDLHLELEREIASFLGTSHALVFSSEQAAWHAALGQLLGPPDLVLHDSLASSVIRRAAAASAAQCRAFPHGDVAALAALLTKLRQDYRQVLIVAEAICPLSGELLDLPKLMELKDRHRAMLVVDETHALGTIGQHGRGLGEHFGIHPRDVDLWCGSLAYTLASQGGYLAGGREMIEFLQGTDGGFSESTAVAPASAASALVALRRLEDEPERVARCQANSQRIRSLLAAKNVAAGGSASSPLVIVPADTAVRAMRISEELWQRGINVQPIYCPAEEPFRRLLQLMVTANHLDSQLQLTVDALVPLLAEGTTNHHTAPLAPHYSLRQAAQM